MERGLAARGDLLNRMERLPLTGFHLTLLATIFVGTAFDFSDQIALSFVIPVYSGEWGLTPATTRIHPMLGIAGTIIGAFLFGRIADRIGRKNAFLVTLLIFSATSGLNAFTPREPELGFWWVVVNCFFMGIGVGGEIPLGFTLISEYVPTRLRGRAEILIGGLAITGGYIIAATAAFVFLPLEGASLGPIPLGWRAIFFVSAFPALLAAIIRSSIPESPRHLLADGRIREAERIVRTLEARARLPKLDAPGRLPSVSRENENLPEARMGERSLATLWRGYLRTRTALAWTYSILGQFFVLGFLVWLPSYLERLGYITHEASLYGTMINIIAVPSALVTAVLFERWSTRKTMAGFSVVAGAAMLIFAAVAGSTVLSQALLIGLGAIITFFGVTIVMGAFPPYLTEIYPTELRGTGSGSAVAFGRVGAVIGIFAGGGLLASAVPIVVLPIVFGVPILAAGVLMALFGVETRMKTLEQISARGVSP